MSITHKSLVIDGNEVLLIKWQDDDEQPSIRMMTHIRGIYAQSELSFPGESERDHAYTTMAEFAAEGFVRMVKSASGGGQS